MCGIAGFIDTRLRTDEAEALLEKMLQQIAHRGPDARGKYRIGPVSLGQNRLSIIDLSPDGNQPMEYFDSVITYNGEIYNYLEIKAELVKKGYRFSTTSDSEVILAAYREYGTACVNQFIGMWAFALWDKLKNELFCSRDRFGIKPFYYILDGDRFYFGSEYKALKPTPVFGNELNLNQVSRGLQMGWVCYHDETYYQKLKSLPAAGNLIYKDGKLSVTRYWDLSRSEEIKSDIAEVKEKFRALLENSVSIHMRSDVEIAVCLSGGIDSSSLTGLMTKIFPNEKFKSFSIYYDGPGEVDERPFINAVIDKYPSISPNFYRPLQEEILSRFHEIIHQVDVPATGSSNFSHYYLIQKIHQQNIKVVVDGQGADEYLGGYMHSMYRYNADCIRNFALGSLFTNISATRKYQQSGMTEIMSSLGKTALSVFMNEMQLYSLEYKKYFPFVSNLNPDNIPFKLGHPFKNSLSNFLYHLLSATSLPTILHYVDRMTMAHSVESRVPFLDHRLVEYAFTLSNNLKINNGITKFILRESVKDLLPDKIYSRRDKKGFVTPGEEIWLRGPMKHLLEVNYKRIDFLNSDKVKSVIEGYKKGDNRNAKLVWRLATLNYWIENFQ